MTERLSGRAWQRIREQVIQRDGCVCYLCNKITRPSMIEVDHVIPLSAGGSNDLDNLRTACRRCNQAKRAGKAKGCHADGTPMDAGHHWNA